MSVTRQDEILKILSQDARTPPEKIAKLTGQSHEEVLTAIAEYEKRGVIKRYKTIVDWEKLGGEEVLAFIDVKVIPAREVGFDAVARRIYRYPEVRSLWLVSGGHDLRVVVEGNNLRELGRFVAEKLATIEGVTATDTHFVLRRYKEDHDLFVDAEEDDRLVVSP
jgi:DNA-binding Lrp family transcriptional regulator